MRPSTCTELTAEQARVKPLEEMLREQRIGFEQDREREQRDKALEQQEREREREYWRNREQEREHEIQEERDRRIQAKHEAEKAEMVAGYERQLREVEKKMTETALHDRAGTDDQRNPSALRDQELHRMTQESLLEFSLPVNHSSTDVIVDLANCFALMRETRSDGTAVSDVTATTYTIAGLFDKVNEKSPSDFLCRIALASDFRKQDPEFITGKYSESVSQRISVKENDEQRHADGEYDFGID